MRRRLLVPTLALAAAASLVPLAAVDAAPGPVTPAAASPVPAAPARVEAGSVAVRWAEASPAVRVGGRLVAEVQVGEVLQPSTVVVGTEGARVTAVPEGCTPSSIIHERSSITPDGRLLRCLVQPGAWSIRVPLAVTAAAGDRVVLEATTGAAGAATSGLLSLGGSAEPAAYRFVSSPDFLNADVGDLRRGPSRWRPGRSENSVNGAYRTGLATVLDTFAAERPGAVLVAGDMVEGHWGDDPTRARVFGPVDTHRQRVRAVRRAAATYYPQWLERFRARGLQVLPAVGDHELGDNPWRPGDRALTPTFEKEWARWFARRADGSPRWTDRPRGSRHEMQAYAVRPVPELQLVTLDVFDITRDRARVQVDDRQLAWLRRVLKRAQRDEVPWVVVQGHTPVLPASRSRGSSGLQVRGGARSSLWQTFRRYGVDLYLAGEVHDVGVAVQGGVVQVTHGGMFAYGLTNYLRADVHEDRLELELRDFDIRSSDARDGSRLFQTRRGGLPKNVRVAPRPFTIGTMTLGPEGLRDTSGVLRPGS